MALTTTRRILASVVLLAALASSVRAELGVSLTVYHLSIRDPQGAALERGTQVDSRLHAGLSWVWP